MAAYLVLVCGLGQYTIGKVVDSQRAAGLNPCLGWAEVVGWNLASGAVIAVTLTGIPMLVDLGGLLLILAIVLAWRIAPTPEGGSGSRADRFRLWAYRIMLAIFVLGTVVGILLAHLNTL